MKHKLLLVFTFALIVLVNERKSQALAQAVAFTYQGRILDHGTNFTGSGQFKFALVSSINTSSQAIATANLDGPFVTSYIVTYGGRGYLAPPLVSISGGGGVGAFATAIVSGGVVTGLTPVSAGMGYTNPPTVTIAPPTSNLSYTSFWSNDGTSSAGSEPVAFVPVPVINGLFTVVMGDTNQPNMAALNAGLFSQSNLQLRIWFNDTLSGFAALNPSQNLSPTPYAIQAVSAASASSVSATNITGAFAPEQLPVSVVTNGASNLNLTGVFRGDGSGLTNFLSPTSEDFLFAFSNLGVPTIAALEGDYIVHAGSNIYFNSQGLSGGWATSTTCSGTNCQTSFLAAHTGVYFVQYVIFMGNGSGPFTYPYFQSTLNGVVIPGSGCSPLPGSTGATPISFITRASAGDNLAIQCNPNGGNVDLTAFSGGCYASITILRIK